MTLILGDFAYPRSATVKLTPHYYADGNDPRVPDDSCVLKNDSAHFFWLGRCDFGTCRGENSLRVSCFGCENTYLERQTRFGVPKPSVLSQESEQEGCFEGRGSKTCVRSQRGAGLAQPEGSKSSAARGQARSHPKGRKSSAARGGQNRSPEARRGQARSRFAVPTGKKLLDRVSRGNGMGSGKVAKFSERQA